MTVPVTAAVTTTITGPSRSAAVAMGANLPWGASAPEDTLVMACEALARAPDVLGLQASTIWRSAPVAALGPNFVNAAVMVQTRLCPEDLLRLLFSIELAHGRQRTPTAGLSPARTLDLDLIWMEGEHRQSAELTLPHPRATHRGFVMGPMQEIAPNLLLASPCGQTHTVAHWWGLIPPDPILSSFRPMR